MTADRKNAGNLAAFAFSPEDMGGRMPRSPFELMGPVTMAMTQAGQALSEGIIAMNAEWMTFLGARLRDDWALQGKLAACGTAQDAVREWTVFFEKAARDYSGEWVAQTQLSNAAGFNVSSAFQKGLQQISRQAS